MQNRDVVMVDTPIESPKQVVCRLAKAAVHVESRVEFRKKIDELRNFLFSGHSVDVDLYRNPPTGILMEEDEEAAALLLVKHFGADPSKVAYHYARQKRINEALEIANTYANSLTYQQAITGFVDGMDTSDATQVQMLFDFIDGMDFEDECAFYAATQLAKNGNQDILLDLALRYIPEDENSLDIYTARKDTAKVNRFLQRNPHLSTYAAMRYLWSGHRDEAIILMSTNHVEINEVIRLAAKLEDNALVDELLDKGASIDEAAHGYASAGNIDKVNTLIARGANVTYAFSGLLASNHCYLLDKYFPDDLNADIISEPIDDMKYNPGIAIKSLAFIQNDEHRRAIAQMFQSIPDIYKRSTNIHNLMNEFYLDYDSAKYIEDALDSKERKSFIYYLRERHMTFEQANAIKFEPATKTWYKQAKALTENNLLNNNITALVASYAYALPYDDGETLRQKIAPSKCKASLFSPSAPDKKQPAKKRKPEIEGTSKRPRS